MRQLIDAEATFCLDSTVSLRMNVVLNVETCVYCIGFTFTFAKDFLSAIIKIIDINVSNPVDSYL